MAQVVGQVVLIKIVISRSTMVKLCTINTKMKKIVKIIIPFMNKCL